MARRLLVIHAAVGELIDRHHPARLRLRLLFFAQNVTTAMTVGQARGTVLLAAAQRGVPVAEYAPSEVKQAVVGYGKADKAQIQEMVRLILGLASSPPRRCRRRSGRRDLPRAERAVSVPSWCINPRTSCATAPAGRGARRARSC